MKEKVSDLLSGIILENYKIEIKDLVLEVPPKKDLGDYAFPCFQLSRELKKSPNAIAEELQLLISENLSKYQLIEEVSIVGPYLNIKLNKDIYSVIFSELLYSYSNKGTIIEQIGNNEKIVVDYIGANVGKPLHIGHMCTPNQGQAMINIYKKLGYDVISDSHIGDWGIIFGKLITAFKKYGDKEELKENAVEHLFQLYVKISDEAEKNEKLGDTFRNEFKLLSEGDSDSVKLWESFTKESIIAMNKQLSRLNIKPDFNIGESFYEGLNLPKMENYPDLKYSMKDIVKELIEKGIAIKNNDNSVGVVFSDESRIPSCILQKRDGTHGYLASDLASIKYRVENWNPKNIIYFVDARQQLHLKQTFEVASMAGWISKEELFHAYNGFISLKDGAMSTRKGKIIKLDKLLDEAENRAKKIILEKRDDIKGEELESLSKIIGIGAIKYGYLKKSRETDVVFDWDEFMTFEGNSGPYIQYAYVRAIRILEKANIDLGVYKNNQINYVFETSAEVELIKSINNYNKVLLESVDKNMPHILGKYSYELTKNFNTFYNSVHVINETNETVKISRLLLVDLFMKILKESFELLGIEMPDKM